MHNILGYGGEGAVPYLKAAFEVCKSIYRDQKVYLLNAVLIERELLKNELHQANDSVQVNGVIARFEGNIASDNKC